MKLKDYLKDNGVKGCWLASQIPCSTAYITMLKKGQRRPTQIYINRIEEITNGKVTRKDFYEE